MSKTINYIIFIAIIIILSSSIVNAVSSPVFYKGKEYFKVTSTDTTEDSGALVCAKLNKTCIGYTGNTLDICKTYHTNAGAVTVVSGSSAGFYCDGQPQTGICATQSNSCDICPACNVNADCNTIIGDQYREMYVECSPADNQTQQITTVNTNQSTQTPSLWQRIIAWFANLFGRPKTQLILNMPNESFQVAKGHWACDFYQTNKALVTCGLYKAADSFCAVSLQSQYAIATRCEDKGVILCENPCKANPQQVIPKTCPYDNARPRGAQAPPITNC